MSAGLPRLRRMFKTLTCCPAPAVSHGASRLTCSRRSFHRLRHWSGRSRTSQSRRRREPVAARNSRCCLASPLRGFRALKRSYAWLCCPRSEERQLRPRGRKRLLFWVCASCHPIDTALEKFCILVSPVTILRLSIGRRLGRALGARPGEPPPPPPNMRVSISYDSSFGLMTGSTIGFGGTDAVEAPGILVISIFRGRLPSTTSNQPFRAALFSISKSQWPFGA